MKRLIVALILSLCFSCFCAAQDKPEDTRFEITGITLTPNHLDITVVKAGKTEKYKVDLINGVMSLDGKDREFNLTTAANVNKLVEYIAKFSVQGIQWYNSPEEPEEEAEPPQDTHKEVAFR